MAYKPILFKTEMVQAIQTGFKTQTRRIIKDNSVCRPFNPGDILWVRETWRPAKGIMHTYIGGEVVDSGYWHDGFEYKAGGYHFPDGFKESNDYFHLSEIRSEGNWHPSIHMPKDAARIFLRVKDVRVERLQEITLDDVHAEGVDVSYVRIMGGDCISGRIDHSAERFETLWDSTIKPADLDKYGWNADPLVWVIEFERCEKPEGFAQAIPEGGRPGHEEGTSMA